MRERKCHISLLLLLLSAFTTQAANASYVKLYKAAQYSIKTKGDYDKGMTLYKNLCSQYNDGMTTEEKELCAKSYNAIGYLYSNHYYKYAFSFYYLSKAIDICDENSLNAVAPPIYLNIGNLYATYPLPDHKEEFQKRAQYYYRKGFRMAVETKNNVLAIKCFINLLLMYPDLEGNKKINEDINLFRSLRIPSHTTSLKYAQTLVEAFRPLLKSRHAEAAETLKKLPSSIDDALGPEQYQCEAYKLISKVYSQANKTDSAIEYSRKELQIADRHNLIDYQFEASSNLAKYYAISHEDASAKKYRIMSLEKKEEMTRYTQWESIGEMHFMHELQKKTKQVNDLYIRNKIQKMLSILGLVIILGTLIFSIVIYKKNKMLRRHNHELYRKSVELLSLEQKQRAPETTAAKSKTEISRDLHDTLLSRIKASLADAENICKPNFSMAELVRNVGSNTQYVSQIINEEYGKSFSIQLGDLRVNEACRRINASPLRYAGYTIEAVSAEMGFKSRATFNTAFKRVTGLSPSEYIRQANLSIKDSCPTA